MEAREIFELIVKADEAIKYATEDKVVARAGQARDYLTQALQEAEAIGNQGLQEQARQRLADLQALLDEGQGTGSGAAPGAPSA